MINTFVLSSNDEENTGRLQTTSRKSIKMNEHTPTANETYMKLISTKI